MESRRHASGQPDGAPLYAGGRHVAGSIAYGGVQLTAPLGLVDTGNNYSANISASQRGIQAACVNRQIYGGIADMPGFNKIFLFGGFGYWDANSGSAAIGCTYDYVAKKYQLLDAETWPSGGRREQRHGGGVATGVFAGALRE